MKSEASPVCHENGFETRIFIQTGHLARCNNIRSAVMSTVLAITSSVACGTTQETHVRDTHRVAPQRAIPPRIVPQKVKSINEQNCGDRSAENVLFRTSGDVLFDRALGIRPNIRNFLSAVLGENMRDWILAGVMDAVTPHEYSLTRLPPDVNRLRLEAGQVIFVDELDRARVVIDVSKTFCEQDALEEQYSVDKATRERIQRRYEDKERRERNKPKRDYLKFIKDAVVDLPK